MRTKLLGLVAAILLFAAGATAQEQAAAQPSSGSDIPLVNRIDFGVRGTAFASGSDQARFMRYRDVRDGATLERLRLFRSNDIYQLDLQADHVGYRDQRFFGGYNRFGKVKASFEWNQTPLFYSSETRTLYDTSNGGTLTLPDIVQSGIQNRTLSLATALSGAASFDLRTRRDVANMNVVYTATPNVDVAFVVRNTQKNGAYPWGGSFGISNAIASELPVPVDHRTTDLTSSVEYASKRFYGRLAYDGSFFRNNVTTLIFDNPGRVADSATAGPAQGRISLWPNTNMNTVSASGAVNFAGRSRGSAYISVGNLSNNDPLLPYTINSAIASPALPRATAEVDARVTTMNYSVTSRPTNLVWLSARYRQYDFDNRTEPFEVGTYVNYDTSLVALNRESEPFGQVRHTFDADASFTPTRILGFKVGYTREDVERTHRIVENTTEDIGRASVDLTGLSWLTVRGVFEHAKRRGSAVDGLELLSIGEQPTLRQFDISDRDQDRFSTILVVTPTSQFSVNGSVAFGRQEFPGTNLGLRNNDNQVYSLGFDFVPSDAVSLGASYGYEKYTALQASRTANPLPANTLQYLNDPTQQFNDPRRDWTDDSTDKVHTVDASIDLLKLIPRTDIKVAYDFSRAKSTYVYGLAANTTIAAPVQLTPVLNELQRGTVDARYFLSRQLAVGVVYWYDKYKVDDFALGPVSSLSQPANAASPTLMMLGYFYKPYTANSVMARLTYLW